MTRNSLIGSATLFGVICLIVRAVPAPAQAIIDFDTLASVSISTDKLVYSLFEPVVATITVQNVSDRNQFYGPPTLNGRTFDFILVDPKGDTLEVHDIQHLGSEYVSYPQIAYKPGQSYSADLVATLLWSLWDTTGTYTIQIYSRQRAPTEGLFPELVAYTSFDIEPAQGVDDEIVVALRLAANGVLGKDLGEDVRGAIDTVLTVQALPSSFQEFAAYLDAAYADLVWLKRSVDRDVAVAKYLAFENTFPNSAFSSVAPLGLVRVSMYNAASVWDSLAADPTFLFVDLLLEGSYNGPADSMSAHPVVPTGQPYGDIGRPHGYRGIERSDPTGQPAGSDWILVALSDTLPEPDTVVARTAMLLRSNGKTRGAFYDIPPGHYRVIVDHRNHLAVASDTLVDFTNGYAEHDFTTGAAQGNNPQKQIISGQDTVYAMYAGDANVDCVVATSDFDEWLTDTRAIETGYLQTDFNMDAQVTTPDFERWHANAKGSAHSPNEACLTNEFSGTPATSVPGEALSKTLTADHIQTDYLIQGSDSAGVMYVKIATRTIPTSEVDTLGSATFDVYYNSDQLYYVQALDYQPLLAAGYELDIDEGTNEYGSFVRVLIYTSSPDSAAIEIDGDYYRRHLQLRFYENAGPITSHDVAFNLATLDVAVIRGGAFFDIESTVISYRDTFTY